MTDEECAALLQQVPAPPDGAVFVLQEVRRFTLPHPYCIGGKHVAVAADQFGGMLSIDAIEAAEAQGAVCDICRNRVRNHQQASILPYKQHVTESALFIAVPQNKDLNAVPGLHAYLLSVKDRCTELGIDGFAFPLKGEQDERENTQKASATSSGDSGSADGSSSAVEA